MIRSVVQYLAMQASKIICEVFGDAFRSTICSVAGSHARAGHPDQLTVRKAFHTGAHLSPGNAKFCASPWGPVALRLVPPFLSPGQPKLPPTKLTTNHVNLSYLLPRPKAPSARRILNYTIVTSCSCSSLKNSSPISYTIPMRLNVFGPVVDDGTSTSATDAL